MTKIVIENNQIVSGDLELIRRGGDFPATINGHDGFVTCEPGYHNVKFIKVQEAAHRMESEHAELDPSPKDGSG